MMKLVKPILLFVCVIMPSSTFAAETNQSFRPMQGCIGITFGTPAGLNLVGTYYGLSGYGARIAGGYFPGDKGQYVGGVQVSFLRKLYEVRDGVVDASLIAGYSESDVEGEFDKWSYLGVAWDFSWRRFFAETQLTVGTGTFESPQFGFQLGLLLYRERRQE